MPSPEKIIVGEGTVAAGEGYHRPSDKEAKVLALDLVEGRAFATWMIRKHDEHLLPVIFMPLGLMDDIARKQMAADKIVHLYGRMDKASPRSVNGYPCFMSMGVLNAEDTKRVGEQIDRLIEVRKTFMEDEA